jgi:hypothetical protein
MNAARRSGLGLCGLILIMVGGCSIGPDAIRLNMQRYNEAVADTEEEQFLLNIVRLRYRDPPKSLNINNVTSSFDVDATAPVSSLTETPIGIAGMAAFFNRIWSIPLPQAHAADQPTISFQPLGGVDYTIGLVSAIPVDRIVGLANTGWDLDRLLRLLVHNMNGVENVPHLAGQGGERVPRFHEFVAMAQTLGRLQHEGLLELANDPIPVAAGDLSEPTALDNKAQDNKPKNSELTKSLIDAASSHYMFHNDGNTITLRKTVNVHDLNFAPEAWQDPEMPFLSHSLKLIPGLFSYRLLPADLGQFKRQFAGPGSDIVVGTRSVLGMMVYISKGVVVPEQHFNDGIVPVTKDPAGAAFDWTQVTDGLFRVCVQKTRPKHAFVAVKYRGYWFYIADGDGSSKSTFDLVLEAHNVQITQGLANQPILTVPVGAGSGSGKKGG